MATPRGPAEAARVVQATKATKATKAQGRQWLGLLLLIVGFLLAVGSFTLPWVTITCSANCVGAPSPGLRVPLGNVVVDFWPLWLVAAGAACLTARQEWLPVARRGAFPALLLAGLLLLAQTLTLLLLLAQALTLLVASHLPASPVLTSRLTSLSAVGPLGSLLVAFGGWLRYHRQRSAIPSELAEVPAER
jgi:hypothetical protein